jgi:hypothetical protein
MALYDVRPRPRSFGIASLVFGLFGLFFYWWVPLGMVLSLSGLMAAFIGWVTAPRGAAARALLVGGLVLSGIALGLDLYAVDRGLETVRLTALR